MVEEVGVAVFELLGDLESPAVPWAEESGEAAPELLLVSFFLEDLLESLARDNCSCYSFVSRLSRSDMAVSEGLASMGIIPLSV